MFLIFLALSHIDSVRLLTAFRGLIGNKKGGNLLVSAFRFHVMEVLLYDLTYTVQTHIGKSIG